MSLAVLFPGQGSQHVGMGADVFEARPDLLGPTADRILGWSLREMCLEGPEDALTRTEHAQPALFAVCYALWEEFRMHLKGQVSGAAGHSLGEFTALCAAGALPYPEALEVVARRGVAMARAADLDPSGMAALIGAQPEQAEEIASRRRESGGRLEVANLNAPGQVVVAGSASDIEWLVSEAPALGLRRVIPLKVAGAFHSSFMEQATEEIGAALASVRFRTPAFRVWSNTTARPHDVAEMAAVLRSQVVSTVRFAETLEDMASEGMTRFVHVGPGDVTAGMARKTVPGAEVHRVSALEEARVVAEALVSMG